MMSSRARSTLYKKFLCSAFAPLILLLSISNLQAESFSDNAKNWKDHGGQLIASGSQHFSNGWTRGPNGKYWKNGEDPYKVKPRHTEEEVRADIWVNKGQFVVQGPGSIGYAMKNKGIAVSKIWQPGEKANFIPQGMGGLTMNKVKGEWSGEWVQAYSWLEMTPGKPLSGWVPEGVTATFDIICENRPRGNGYDADTEIHYEYWFFPREGGKVIQSSFDQNQMSGNSMEYAGYIQAIIGNGKVYRLKNTNDPYGTELKYGDKLYFSDILVSKNAMAKIILDSYRDEPVIMVKSDTKIQLIPKQKKPKGGIFTFFGKLFFEGYGRIEIVTSNAAIGVEGTSFDVEFDSNSEKSTVSVFEGKVEFSCNKGTIPPLTVTSGLTASLDKNCGPTLGAIDPAVNTPAKAGWIMPSGSPTSADGALSPIADSHVYAYSYRGWNQANWGKYEILGAGWNPTGGEKRTYLKFDVSDIDKASFKKATLKLHHYHSAGSDRVELGIYTIRSPWNEGNGTYKPSNVAAPGEISWVNQPQLDPYPVTMFNPGMLTNDVVEVDITALVGSWVNGMENHGLVIKTVDSYLNGSESMYGFYAREHEHSDKWPQLIINGGLLGASPGMNQTPLPPAYAPPVSNSIKVISATYGENCGAPKGNVSKHIAASCDGKSACSYTVDYKVLGDPAYRCKKNYTVQYQCGEGSGIKSVSLSAEAGLGNQSVQLTCDGMSVSPMGHVTGTWSIHQSNGYNHKFILRQDSNGKLTGESIGNVSVQGKITGTVSGNHIEFTVHYSWGKGFYNGILTADKTRIINGATRSSTGGSATWTAKIASDF